MIEKKITLCNKLGLHARASAKVCDTASKYQANTKIHYGDRQADAKSIMEVMVLGAVYQSEVTISCSGPDEEEALAALYDLISNRFGEPE